MEMRSGWVLRTDAETRRKCATWTFLTSSGAVEDS